MAIEYIHLDEISNPHTVQDSDQPSFGPIWIYLYDRPYILAKQKVFKINLQDLKKESTIANNCKFCEKIKETNTDSKTKKDPTSCSYKSDQMKTVSLRDFNGNCSKYVGRIKIQIESEKEENEQIKMIQTVSNENIYCLFSAINNVNLIHPKYKKSKISFKITLDSSWGNILTQGSNFNEGNYPNYMKDHSIYIPFELNKPVLHHELFIDDQFEISRMKKNNFLKRKIKEMVGISIISFPATYLNIE
jgi:hypothetical protein